MSLILYGVSSVNYIAIHQKTAKETGGVPIVVAETVGGSTQPLTKAAQNRFK